MIIKTKKCGDIKITKEDIDTSTNYNKNDIPLILRDLNSTDINLENITNNILPSLIYISGYAAHSIIKMYNCEYCKEYLTEYTDSNYSFDHTNLITSNNRGDLRIPVKVCLLLLYIVFLPLKIY